MPPLPVSLSRRHFLGTTGALTTGLAGCASTSPGAEPRDDWPAWRHDNHRTGSSQATGPTKGRVLWRKSFDSRPAPPIVTADTIVIGVDDKTVYGLARDDGSVRWTDSLFSGTRSPATILDDTAYVAARTGFYAYDLASGTEQWNVEYPAPGKGWRYHTPAAIENSLYCGVSAFTYNADPNAERFEYRRDQPSKTAGLSITDGTDRWTETTGETGRPRFVPAVTNETVFVGRDQVYALDARDGTIQWAYNPSDVAAWADPAIAAAQNNLVVTGERDVSAGGGILVALDIDTGEEAWRLTTPYVPAPPAVTETTVFLGGDSIFALNPTTGEERWTLTGDRIVAAPPAVTTDTLFVATATGSLQAFDPSDGENRWNLHLSPGLTGPAIMNDILFIGTAQGEIIAVE